jgi:hypothetical protein
VKPLGERDPRAPSISAWFVVGEGQPLELSVHLGA